MPKKTITTHAQANQTYLARRPGHGNPSGNAERSVLMCALSGQRGEGDRGIKYLGARGKKGQVVVATASNIISENYRKPRRRKTSFVLFYSMSTSRKAAFTQRIICNTEITFSALYGDNGETPTQCLSQKLGDEETEFGKKALQKEVV
ncbi:hypothetical protein O181_108571 [Austropuccinia psidii MF-1]|uniref:Uncharacterized protein n=1 Tax=Austropuccinia psidii MF-1 TaxID=1389203 RepID=A0A9Q3JVJ7_9BASI|nr:hypothetical protein [Austropuccinia psidii MF-1]